MSNFRDVLRFHRKMGLPIGDFANPALLDPKTMKDRLNFMLEELTEMSTAADVVETMKLSKDDPDTLDLHDKMLAEIFDGLLDLVYVACGTGVMMGVPWEEGWDLVQAANMRKERREVGQGGKDDHHLSIVKPEGWRPPAIQDLIERVLDHGVDISMNELIARGDIP